MIDELQNVIRGARGVAHRQHAVVGPHGSLNTNIDISTRELINKSRTGNQKDQHCELSVRTNVLCDSINVAAPNSCDCAYASMVDRFGSYIVPVRSTSAPHALDQLTQRRDLRIERRLSNADVAMQRCRVVSRHNTMDVPVRRGPRNSTQKQDANVVSAVDFRLTITRGRTTCDSAHAV